MMGLFDPEEDGAYAVSDVWRDQGVGLSDESFSGRPTSSISFFTSEGRCVGGRRREDFFPGEGDLCLGRGSSLIASKLFPGGAKY